MLFMPKSVFLTCMSVLFLSSFCQTIFSENKKIDRISSDRIAHHMEKIKKDFELHKFQEKVARVSRIAFMATLAGATYVWFYRYHVSETDKALLSAIKNRLAQQENNETISAFLPKTNSVDMPSESLQPQGSLARSGFRSLLRTSKEYSFWILGILSSSTVSWLGSQVISSIDTRFEALIAERTMKWFISHSTLLNETLRQLKHVGLILEPNQKFMNEFTLDLDADVQDGEFFQELSRMKLLSQVLNARHEGQLELRKFYSEKLVALAQQWVFDIEKLIAFIRVSFAIDTYAVNVLERETLQLCDLIEGYLAQGNNQKADFGLVPGVFKAALQLDHVVSHLLFEQQNEKSKSAALI